MATTVCCYDKYLCKKYPRELSSLYEKVICEELQTTGRAHYQYVCEMLKRMKELGADVRVKELKREFLETYKIRRALREELCQI